MSKRNSKMIDNQIERYLKARGVTKKYISEKLGMSQKGFGEAIKYGTLKIRDLYRLSEILDTSLCEILGIREGVVNIQTNKLEIEILRERLKNTEMILKNKDKIISNLEREIKSMTAVIELVKKMTK